MKLRTTLALSAIAVTITAPAAAQAKAHHHAGKAHHHAAKSGKGLSSAEQLELAQEEISQLQAQLNAIQAKIDQQGSGGTAVAVASQAAAASSQAADASAKADQALAVAETAKDSAAKANKGLDLVSWAGNTQVHGTMFFDASNINQHTAGGPNTSSGTGFNIKRLYLGVDHQFNKVFSASVLTDISNVVGNSATNANTAALNSTATTAQTVVGKGFYVKNAFLQAKIDPALVIRVGAAPLPWIPYVEGQYGHRYVENVITDEYKYGNSADWGVHVLGDLANGLISYQVSAVDGAGYRKVYVTRSVDLEGRISAQYKGAWAAIGGYTGKLGLDTESTNGLPTTFHTATRANAALGYKNSLFNIGGEYFYARNYNSVTNAATEDAARGISAFGNINVTPKWQLFGRYDWVREIAVRGSGKSASSHYFNVGVQWEPVKIVDLSLVYKRDAVTNEGVASIATQNGTIGGTTLGTDGTYDEIGIFGQVKF